MDITVLTNHVALDNLMVKDVGGAIDKVMACQDLEVALVARHGHVIVKHILSREVHHRSHRVVEHGQHGVATILKPREILVVNRHVLRCKIVHRIGETHVGSMFDQLSLLHFAGGILFV